MKTSLAPAITSLVLLGACAPRSGGADATKITAAIRSAEEAQVAALGRRDLDGAVAVFDDHATLYVPGMPPATGRAAIRAANEMALKDPALSLAPDEASRKWWVSASGDLAATSYASTWTHTDPSSRKPVTEWLVSQTTWRRATDGTWRNVSDINAVYPAPVPGAR